jgi:serine/threonine-protein kinase RsbW
MTNSQVSREVEFFSLPENINLIEIFIEELKGEFSLSIELEANMLVALSEAVNNAIFHGNRADPGKRVHFHMEKNNNEFLFVIEDEGSGFNPADIRDPTAPENLDKPSGRGIFLMRNLADRVEFDKGGKKVLITFIQH